MNVLITGGTGYIGAHICTQLLERDYRVAILVRNSNRVDSKIAQIEALTGRKPWIFRGDVCNESDVSRALRVFKPTVVVHAAGIKTLNGSVNGADRMMKTNVGGTRCLMEIMAQQGIRRLVHLSSSCVTGSIDRLTPYARSKLIAEAAVREQARRANIATAVLRIHAVAGNHTTGFLAEDEESAASSFFAQLAQVAVGDRPHATIYPVIRDYVHVKDVARAAHKCLPFLLSEQGMVAMDIGTGRGYNPVDVVDMFEKVSGKQILYRRCQRPVTMPPLSVADPTFAESFLGWRALNDLERMCRDTWFVHTTGLNRSSPVPFSRIASCRSSL